eukprot:m.97371 g.97371  ORF g.97371 m.97371 type:complete len:1025 (-) comp13593_c0_seq2:109-3183(-)
MAMQFLFCMFSVLVLAEAIDLNDIPIAADAIHRLDGQWNAYRFGPRAPGKCTYVNNSDWNEGAFAQSIDLTKASVSDMELACCDACYTRPSCRASVLDLQAPNAPKCYFKTADDVKHGLKPTTLATRACVLANSTLTVSTMNITATVPGDVVTDLQKSGVIRDPLFEVTFRDNSSLWSKGPGDTAGPTWTYETTFDWSAKDKQALLVFDGIKMGARIELNGNNLGVAEDQFLRYVYPVTSLLNSSGNVLKVEFDWSISTNGRFMACSGGWDWAPVSNSVDCDGLADFTRGIWKSVYIAEISTIGITHVVPKMMYQGPYPTEPLTEETKGDFKIDVEVHIWSPAQVSGDIQLSGSWDNNMGPSLSTTLQPGDNIVNVPSYSVSNKSYNLWWPNGLGPCYDPANKMNEKTCNPRPLYNLTVAFTPKENGAPKVETVRRIGFRYAILVTGNDTDKDFVKNGGDGTDTFTMRFKVNGVNFYARGANMIPMEMLEGRADANALQLLVKSAADANFNMLRIWGGGIFLYKAFYDAADELGILIFHDMQFAQQGHAPQNTTTETAELEHQVRRLSAHTSIVILDGCNECGGTGSNHVFVMDVVASANPSLAMWPSCPSGGWESGVDRLTTIPNGKPLVPKSGAGVNESHGPYVIGDGFPSDEASFWDVGTLKLFEPDTTAHIVTGKCGNPPVDPSCADVSPTVVTLGAGHKGWFKSEFGCSVWSSFESLSPLLNKNNYGLHTTPMIEHNWPADNVIKSFWGSQQNLNETGEIAFKRQLYQSMVGQALFIKAEVEGWRSSNVWGTLIWQYNEIWPTGGWGSIEYGSPGQGIVTGGRWKPLHYQLKNSVFTDIVVSCCAKCPVTQNCFVVNSGMFGFQGVVNISVINLATSKTTVTSKPIKLEAGPSSVWFGFPLPEATTNVLQMNVVYDGVTATSNTLLLAAPKNLKLQPADVTATVADKVNTDGSVSITIKSTAPAVAVVLTTLAQGRFSNNMFTVLPTTETTVQFIPFDGNANIDILKTTLRVEHCQQMQ